VRTEEKAKKGRGERKKTHPWADQEKRVLHRGPVAAWDALHCQPASPGGTSKQRRNKKGVVMAHQGGEKKKKTGPWKNNKALRRGEKIRKKKRDPGEAGGKNGIREKREDWTYFDLEPPNGHRRLSKIS